MSIPLANEVINSHYHRNLGASFSPALALLSVLLFVERAISFSLLLFVFLVLC